VRIEALPLGERTVRDPLCPPGSSWDGQECVREQVVTRVSCPPGSRLEASGCVASDAGSCAADMVFVPAGSFTLASASGEPARLAQVGDLCIDRTEVTAKEYLRCVSAGRCTRVRGCEVSELIDPRTNVPVQVPSTADNPSTHDHPMNCVSSKEAQAYCAFANKRLPTEAEWVWAARGGPLGRRFPWGDDPPTGHACWLRARKGTCAAGSVTGDRTAHGIVDMGGNVREWTSSVWQSFPISRGGSFFDKDPSALLVTAKPGLFRSLQGQAQYGFRCAR
jgi:formylglycine-generating enzyme required for sulfatase activity